MCQPEVRPLQEAALLVRNTLSLVRVTLSSHDSVGCGHVAASAFDSLVLYHFFHFRLEYFINV